MSSVERSAGSAAARVTVDAVATHHLDSFRSGVARFNELLAERLSVPLVPVAELGSATAPLLSFKVSELDAAAARSIEEWLDGGRTWEVYLHEYTARPLERALVEGAARVICGNAEIEEQVRGLNENVETLWTPGLVLDDRPFPTTELSVFTFGMAHKIRTDMFRRLAELLDASGRSYAVYVSAANHETASLRDAEEVFAEMHEIFPESMYFLGNLSDVAIYNWLATTTFFASFFVGGVRGNNTSVASAMERGAVVITNLDEWSPPHLVHDDTVIDIASCTALPSDEETLERLSRRARESTRSRGWDALVERIRA